MSRPENWIIYFCPFSIKYESNYTLPKKNTESWKTFLTGELPIEAKIHKDIFSLFLSIWCNPDTKVHEIAKYLVTHSTEHSKTWSRYLVQLCTQYGLKSPSEMMKNDPPM